MRGDLISDQIEYLPVIVFETLENKLDFNVIQLEAEQAAGST